MFSESIKSWVLRGLIVTLPLTQGGCLHVGALPEHSEPSLRISSLDTHCLDSSGPLIRAYLAADASLSDPAIEGFWDCIDRSVQLFATRVQGADPSFYTAQEIRQLVLKYFLKGADISDGFLSRLMQLKALVLGGPADRLMTSEFVQVHEWIRLLRSESLRFHQLTPYLSGRVALDPISARRISGEARKLAIDWARILGSNGVNLPFSLLSGLCDDFAQFVSTSGLAQSFMTAKSELIWVQRYKFDFLPGPADQLLAADWPRVLEHGARALEVVLMFKVFQQSGQTWLSGPGKDQFVQVVGLGLDLLRDLIARSSAGVWPTERMNVWIVGASSLFGQVSPLAVEQATASAIGRLFSVGGVVSGGLAPVNIDQIAQSIDHWSQGQSYIDALYDYLAQETAQASNADGKGYPPEELLGVPISALGIHLGPETQDAVTRVRRIIENSRPIFVGEDDALTFPARLGDRNSHHNLTLDYALHEVAQRVFEGYAPINEDGTLPSQVNFAQINEFYAGFKQLGVDLKILGPNADALVAQRYKEANLFTFAADGDELLSLDEGAQIAAYLWSAKSLSGQIFSEISSVCPQGAPDPYGRLKLEYHCYRANFFRRVPNYWIRLPELARYYSEMSQKMRQKFEESFLGAALGAPVIAAGWVGSGDTDGVAMVGYYLEQLFARFDTDDSGTLDLREERPAFPVFKSVLQQASGFKSNSELEALFTFMLRNGSPPAPGPLGIAAFLGWEAEKPFWRFEANRSTLISIFATLGQFSH